MSPALEPVTETLTLVAVPVTAVPVNQAADVPLLPVAPFKPVAPVLPLGPVAPVAP